MKRGIGSFDLSASDLVGHLNCQHLTELDRAVAQGRLAKPYVHDPLVEILWQRGLQHEKNFVEHLKAGGLEAVVIDGTEISDEPVAQTIAAMRSGVPVIVQGALRHERWRGRADVLRRVETPSALGPWSYEPIDTKLARETKAGAVLQLCVYSDLLHQTQGTPPEEMAVIVPWSDYEPRKYRFADFAAYYRRAKRSFEHHLEGDTDTYPDPKEHCDICRWRGVCTKRRRDDDHLCLVAGISKLQTNELRHRRVDSLHDLAALPLPLAWKPDRGSSNSYIRVREQARIQFEARESKKNVFELLPVEPGFGLTCLPEPSEGDIFFDLEGDSFVGEHGLEYLFGYVFQDHRKISGGSVWALSRSDEKQAFEGFIDFVMDRWKAFPDLHIYHYAAYEPAALKRLVGRYATREEELDQILRAKLFVDLFGIVRHSLRASVESYSIKRLEPFYGFVRAIPLEEVNAALTQLQAHLELEDVPAITDELRSVVASYNRDDCLSALRLRNWLETLRSQSIESGTDIPRPEPANDGAPNERITQWLAKITPIIAQLIADVPTNPIDRNEEQQARWILANILDWHRRELKAVWWEFFRLADLSDEELVEERAGLSGLVFDSAAGGTAKAPIHRYRFPPQETALRGGEELHSLGGKKFGSVEAISLDARTIDIKKRMDTAGEHATAVYGFTVIDGQVMANALVRIAEHVLKHGMVGDGEYVAARDLLLKVAPRIGNEEIRRRDETTLQAAVRLASKIKGGVLPIQGPPGAGKTFTGAHMICELVRCDKKVGVTANSHKVIRNLLETTMSAADKLGMKLTCCHKTDDAGTLPPRLTIAKTNDELVRALAAGITNVGAGTAWFWSRPEAAGTVDVLFIDEAAQMSLANVLAVSQAAKAIVLIGDPQQLDQPMQGSHPEGCDASALDHILDGAQTIAPDEGLFLEETWRLHPSICAFTSELFYAGKLHSRDGLSKQEIRSTGRIHGSGLRYVRVAHEGNQASSAEEAAIVGSLVTEIISSGATWIDADGSEAPVTLDDILIITPYNAQVFEIQRYVRGGRIGTVDKFQGQEAPIAIYSTASSSHADAPRGMEFLYSLNRFNVATSRAKCISILVSSPRLFEAECRTPKQMQLVNAFCRYLELAEEIA